MNKRKLGKTDLELSPIAFGAWAIGGWMWGGSEKKDSIGPFMPVWIRGLAPLIRLPFMDLDYRKRLWVRPLRASVSSTKF